MKFGNNPVKNRAIVKTAVHVGQEVRHRDRRLVGEQLHRDIALAGFDDDTWGLARLLRSAAPRNGGQQQRQYKVEILVIMVDLL